ncbi:GumC family protein [Flavisolibacter ginsengisoli]|jgi:capsular exopolysaccharide synthesis family protein|uniref:non-specific protein-tyrosine kinase n=1 Tax=Flavisolibacter ginsengisoli DSM 18119 TaxID=1121884 RepID=A0A1M5BA90_9BACT|nr:polysaccharide biosynthesis tyrosine autokinase [Flavisolibacter ginsengisoli]SHF39419.1 capsular exopolysaccharide family [Flavisolibacter ginsengisoli DSM 18119]
MEPKRHATEKEKNAVEAFMYRYLPYWPLFALLLILAGTAAYMYLHYIAKPVYQISANILIKDEKKGADESKILEALNITSNKTVDNEVEVIQSGELLNEVIDSLHLYAPIFEDGPIVSRSAYTSSPVTIELEYPNNIQDTDRIDFVYNKGNNTVAIEGKMYSLNKWISTPFGVARITRNLNLKTASTNPLYFSLNNPKMVLNSLVTNLRVIAASKLSTVIDLAIMDEVPERGENILNTLIQAYYRSAAKEKNVLAANTLSFIEGRISNVAKELDSIENRLQKFRNQKGVVDLSEQGKLYLQNVGDNDRKMTDINMQLAMLNEVEKYVLSKNNQIGIVPSVVGVKDPLLSSLLQKLYDSQMQYERLKKTIPGGNPAMFSLEAEIDNMRPAILENIQNQRMSLQASKANLNSGTSTYVSMLQTIPQKERELLDISRQQTIKNVAYSFLLQKREEAALTYTAVIPDSKTINFASASLEPISPKKMLVYLTALTLALFIGFGIVSGREHLTNKILFRSDIESLTTIPIVGEVMNIKGGNPIILSNNNNRQLGCIEQFRQLRISSGLNGRHQKNKKILITSSIAGEGKSFISNNLALSLAGSGKKVLLLDFDLRNPKTSALYKLTGEKGISQFLENSKQPLNEIIYHTGNNELYIIPVGFSTINPTELLLNADLENLFEYLDSNFDFIIMDASPIDPIVDAYILSEYADSTLFVIRHGLTTKGMVESLDESNKSGTLKNISIIFNGIKPRGFLNKNYGYGFGYGSKNIYGKKTYKVGSMVNNT